MITTDLHASVAAHAPAQIIFRPESGRVGIVTPLFSTRAARVLPDYSVAAWTPVPEGGIGTGAGLSVRVAAANPAPGEAALELTLSSDHPEGLFLGRVKTLECRPDDTRWAADPAFALHYVHGIFNDPCCVKALGGSAQGGRACLASRTVTVVYDESLGQAVLMGVLPGADAFLTLEPYSDRVEGDGPVGWRVFADFRARLTPGAAFSAGTLLFLSGSDPFRLLETYGDRWAERIGGATKPPRVGWNSWDYYSGSVQITDMEENLRVARAAFDGRLTTWVIDEGWERQWGVWRPNWKFPKGLADFCARVRDAGGEPGIWTAPLSMNVMTPAARYHPEWFIRDANRQPILDTLPYGLVGCLDPTQPGVQALLDDTFGYLRDAGFQYYKLDFLHTLFAADRLSDDTVTPLRALRAVVSRIRAAVGDTAYLLGPAFMEPCAGLLDGARICGDIHTFWSHIVRNANAAAMHYWEQGRLWNNDPDFAVIRCGELSDDPFPNRPYARRPPHGTQGWCAGPEATLEECRAWLSICYLTGGEMILSDALGKLSEDGRAMLRRVLTPLPRGARPLDLFSPHSPPRRWRATIGEGWLMGYFNWSDYAVTLDMDPADWGGAPVDASDFWSDAPVQVGPLRLPPHHARLIRLRAR